MQQQLSPTASTILSNSSLVVTSTLTQRLVFFLSIVRRRSLAAWLEWEATRSPYVLEVVALEEGEDMVEKEGREGGVGRFGWMLWSEAGRKTGYRKLKTKGKFSFALSFLSLFEVQTVTHASSISSWSQSRSHTHP